MCFWQCQMQHFNVGAAAPAVHSHSFNLPDVQLISMDLGFPIPPRSHQQSLQARMARNAIPAWSGCGSSSGSSELAAAALEPKNSSNSRNSRTLKQKRTFIYKNTKGKSFFEAPRGPEVNFWVCSTVLFKRREIDSSELQSSTLCDTVTMWLWRETRASFS